MESLEKQIPELMKSAMKAKDQKALSVIRMLKSAIQYYKIDKKIDELSEKDTITIVSKEINKRKEAIESFRQGGKDEMADKEQFELDFLMQFMPEQLSEEKVVAIIKNIIEETGASGKKDFGKVMKAAMGELKGKTEGKLIKDTVQSFLQS